VSALTPNPSVERRANGRPPLCLISFWPSVVLSLSHAYLERWPLQGFLAARATGSAFGPVVCVLCGFGNVLVRGGIADSGTGLRFG
jgi:hypothetical protein